MHNAIRTATPESVDLTFVPAGLGSRFVAALIDGLLQAVFTIVLSITLSAVGVLQMATDSGENPAIFLERIFRFYITLAIAWMAVPLLYFVLFEALWRGQTPGKRVLGLRVLRVDGRPADFVQILGRNLLRLVDMLPFAYGIGVIAILVTRHSQRLGDLVTGTAVMYEPRPQLLPVSTRLGRDPSLPPALLREKASRLTDAQLEPVRSFMLRRGSLAPAVRERMAARLAAAVAGRMEWTDEIPNGEHFLEEILWLRSGGDPANP